MFHHKWCLSNACENCQCSRFLFQGKANLLLESNGSAEASFLAGLSIDPTDEALLKGLKLAQKDLHTDQEGGGRQKR